MEYSTAMSSSPIDGSAQLQVKWLIAGNNESFDCQLCSVTERETTGHSIQEQLKGIGKRFLFSLGVLASLPQLYRHNQEVDCVYWGQ